MVCVIGKEKKNKEEDEVGGKNKISKFSMLDMENHLDFVYKIQYESLKKVLLCSNLGYNVCQFPYIFSIQLF